jgi:phage/plasmid-like protein (TIGR03299 family)
MKPDASIDEWTKEAGLNWTVESADVLYNVPEIEAGLTLPSIRKMDKRKVLYRSDTKAPLSVVSDEFKIVHPIQIMEFFRDLVEFHGMKIETAGSLFEGKRFWALAEVGKTFEVVKGDKVNGKLLLTTAVDGSLNTTAKFISTRVICANTLSIALKENSKHLMKVSHKSEWDASKVKMELGLIDNSWEKFREDVDKLMSTPLTDAKAKDFLVDVVYKGKDELSKLQERKIEELMDLYKNGMGADMSKNTAWGIVNSITQRYTHGTGRTQGSSLFWNSMYGLGDKIKSEAFEKALILA